MEPQPEANRELVTRAVRGDGLLAVAQAADLGVAETVEPAFLNGPAGLGPDAPGHIAAGRRAHDLAAGGRWGRTDNGVAIRSRKAESPPPSLLVVTG